MKRWMNVIKRDRPTAAKQLRLEAARRRRRELADQAANLVVMHGLRPR
jgi:hypothetical protein